MTRQPITPTIPAGRSPVRLFLVALFLAALSAARAEEWSTNLPCFSGGSYDGWDRCLMTNASNLSDVHVSLSSGSDQSFSWTTPSADLATLTIEAIEPAGSITGGVTMRLSLPSNWRCRFDPNASVSYDGTANAKVDPASLSDNDRTLLIPVTADFAAGNTLQILGLRLLDLSLCSAGAERLQLDFDGDGIRDIYDQYTLEVLIQWPGGAFDGWDRYAMEEDASLLPPPTGTLLLIE